MIKLNNIDFYYGRNKQVLSNLSLSLETGHIHGLLGCNGTGKTTLMKIMSGLFLPQKGNLTLGKHNPAERKPSFLQKLIFIPEEFDLPPISFDYFVRLNSTFYPAFSQELLDGYVSEFNIDRKAHLDRMSMGERKKAYIAFALACQPLYLLMDEPTNGLDIPSKSVFKSMLASFLTPERTVVISTHQVADLQSLVDNVAIMDKSGIVFNKTCEEISQKLSFGALKETDNTLWFKESLSGRIGVSLNQSGKASSPDLEMLFNAVVKNKDKVISSLK